MTSELDEIVAVAAGEVTIRVYTPDAADPLPCHVYFHGGGFWLGIRSGYGG